jgi:hypothetical protein
MTFTTATVNRESRFRALVLQNHPKSTLQIGEMTFSKPDFIFIKSNYFQNAQQGIFFLDDFEA